MKSLLQTVKIRASFSGSASRDFRRTALIGLFVSMFPALSEPANPAADVPLVRTPSNVRINRTVPPFKPLLKEEAIAEIPTEAEIGQLHLFAERLVPVEPSGSQSAVQSLKGLFTKKVQASPSQDNQQIAGTLRGVRSAASPYATSHLEAFLNAQPQSRWGPSVRNELARRQFKQGWFAQAIARWDQLWAELKDRRDPGAVEVANEALSSLLDAYMGLGKADRLAQLLGDQETRPGHPVLQAKVMRARQSVWLLKHKPSQNVMCGPVALYCILQDRHQAFTPIRLNDVTDDYIATGISLSQLQKYSETYKLGLIAAKRLSKGTIPTPAIMHLSAGHFSAVLSETNGYYLLEDRPMQFKGWVPLEALEAQTSGYFLVPSSGLSAGWQAVSESEAGSMYGRDGAHGQEDLSQSVTQCSPQIGGDGPDCGGMPHYSFHQQVASLRVQDTPVGYSPPVGPSVFTRIAYNDLDDRKPVGPPVFSNVGRIWSINWLSYAELTWRMFGINGQTFYIPDYPVTIHVPGGGTEVYNSAAPNDRSFARVILSTNGVLVTRILADGSSEMYNNGGTLTPFFLTQTLDPAGNSLSFTYDSGFRMVAITDAIGQVTTFEHGLTNDIWKVTKITDPFGRFASFAYSGAGNELSSVTDVLGLTTTFTYDTNEFLVSMTTPYGTTTFKNSRPTSRSSYDYSLTATDPEGNTEKVHYIEPIDVPQYGPPVPTVINVGGTNVSFVAEDARLQFRNSYYWDKRAMKLGPDDISVARNYRWLTDSSYLITPILEAYKAPLEARVWYNYPGHIGGQAYASYPYYPGQGGRPEKVMRMLSDGTPQLLQTYYNAQGYLTNVIDPVGRSTIYNYATNLIDLIEVRQKTGANSSDRIAAITWNVQHLPLVVTDAAGQTSQFTYNSRGQLASFTDALNETTTLTYDTNGYLLMIDGPLPGTNDSTRFTYDGFGRLRTYTRLGGFPVTFDYDAFDRVTVISFPDGTHEQFGYDRLDRSFARDRLGHRTDYTWNSLRQLVRTKDSLNQVTRFGWCECGALTSITDPMGRMTTFQYDIENRKIAKQLPDGSQITYVYDPATSHVKSIVDEKGQIKALEYYLDDNLKGISYPNATIRTAPVTCQYDVNYNRMTVLSDGTGSTAWSYYPAGSLGGLEVSKVLASWNNVPVIYQYDALGRGTNRVIGSSGQSYEFDPLGRVTSIINALGIFSCTYDGASERVVDVVSSTSQKAHFDYFDIFGDQRLQKITHTAPNGSLISRFGYAYDLVGNITNWVRETGNATNQWSVGYDAANQLSTVQIKQNSGSFTYAYGYDGAGNRLYEDINGVRRNASYNTLNQLNSSSDLNTNVAYEWDAEARLTAIIKGSVRSEFTYDGFGRRIRIVEKEGGNVVRDNTYLWCDAELCELRDSSGANVLKQIFAQGESVTGAVGTNFYFTRDHLGSIREVLDGSGSLVTRYDYAPFGSQQVIQESYKATDGFAGYFTHGPSGLNLTLFRALNTDDGRWLSRDPLQEKAGVNLYAYVKNRPLVISDPLGLDGAPCTSFDAEAAAQSATDAAKKNQDPYKYCARFTMNAIDLGCGNGLKTSNRKADDPLHRPDSAYQFGQLLSNLGFSEVSTSDYQTGDVIIFEQGKGDYSHGHMEIFNGTQWVSDFVQKSLLPMERDQNWKNLKKKTYRHHSVPPKPSCTSGSDDSKPTPKPDRPWMDFGPFTDSIP
jgi:RHS repeat-associated protein